MDSVLTVLLKVKARMTDVRFFSDGVSTQGQHANNERTAMYDSLLTLSTMLLAKARSHELQTPTAGLDGEEGQTLQLESLVIPDASEDDGRRRKRTRQRVNSTPDPVQMPVASFKTGCTPTNRSKADNKEMFKNCCESCLGLYYGQVVPDPDIMSMVAKDKRIRRKCFYCDSRTDWFCFWCRRWLCNSRPNRTGIKASKYFTVDTPVLDKQGRLQPAPEDS